MTAILISHITFGCTVCITFDAKWGEELYFRDSLSVRLDTLHMPDSLPDPFWFSVKTASNLSSYTLQS